MATQQEQAQALGDPTRHRIFLHLRAATEPVLIADLVALLGFNHNAIRQHLAKLLEADLIVEMTEHRTTRGRPRRMYEARDDALDAFVGEIGSYEWLTQRLLELHESGDTPYDVGRRAGLAEVVARSVAAADPMEHLVGSLRRGGFEPAVDASGKEPDAAPGIVLGRCPFADAAAKSPAVVCELHRGLIDGHLEAAGRTSVLTVADPHEGGCAVAVTLGDTRNARP